MKKTLGLYIHIPFCERKCNYCGFLSFVMKENNDNYFKLGENDDIVGETASVKDYFDNLLKEIDNRGEYLRDKYVVDTIFIGGGTPSAVDEEYIEKLLKKIKLHYDVHEDVEITIEANPNSLTEKKIVSYKNAGINRISIGVQSFDDDELRMLGRLHNEEMAIDKINLCRKLGIENLSVDLIFDLPDQKFESWHRTLIKAISLGVDHISAYSLQIEEGTKFYREVKMGSLSTADDEKLRKFYDLAVNELTDAGYDHYEISNFSKIGKESGHNIKYWKYEEYLGIGIGASSYILNKRWENPKVYSDYGKYSNLDLEDFDMWLDGVKENSEEEEMGIFIFTALRMKEGVNLREFKKIFGKSFREVYPDKLDYIKKEAEKGNCILDCSEKRLFLTENGFLKSNDIMCEFV